MSAGPRNSRYIGNQANVGIDWQMTPCTSWALYCSHFFAGSAVTDAGGRDVGFIGSWLEYQF